jgi:thiamine-phosphate pyrophosphorylase
MSSIEDRRVDLPRLQAIVDVEAAGHAGWAPADVARAFLDGGAAFLQVRAKHLPSGPFLDLCDRIVAMAAPSGAIVIVNDRADLARLSGAAGVHLGQDDVPPAGTRAQLGPSAVIGRSTHSAAQLEQALQEPVTYVAVGPVFGSRTKDTGYDAIGLAFVADAAARAARRPVVAIGGITLDTAPAVLQAGAACVAVISDLLAGGDPAVRVRRYLDRLST